MYKSYRDEAIVIKSINYSEADKILTLFGRYNGKFSVIAKSIRKINSKNRGNLQTLFVSDVYYLERSSSDLGILKESKLIQECDYNKENLDNVQRILFFLNKFLQFKQPEEAVYFGIVDLLKNGFSNVNINDFRLDVMRELGFLGADGTCQRCENDSKKILVHPRTLELVCEECFERMEHFEKGSRGFGRDRVRSWDDIASDEDEMVSFLDKYVKSVAF